jgi:hypothetical protein
MCYATKNSLDVDRAMDVADVIFYEQMSARGKPDPGAVFADLERRIYADQHDPLVPSPRKKGRQA